MAVIQISRIQQRRGQTAQTGFPQLASGEFGWSIDTQELYIGNGAVSEGAPAVGNTRLLTENDNNFFALASNGYTYGDSLPDAVPGVVSRSVQSKLDDLVNLNDFILADSTASDFTSVVQYAVSYAASVKKPLYVPEGTYNITETILISPYTEIRGAGQNKTILTADTTSSIFQIVDGAGNQYPSMTSGLNTPQNVNIDGITFQSTFTNANPILRLDCLSDSVISNCGFVGFASTSTAAQAINLRGQGALTCDNITITDCVFDSVSSSVYSNYDIQNINIIENTFANTDEGVILAPALTGATGSYYGPTRINIENNSFTNINKQGIYLGANASGAAITKSSNNSFINVGNSNYQNEYSQTTDVINFGSFGSSSSEDNFARLSAINTGSISGYTNIKPVVRGPVAISSKVSAPVAITGVSTIPVFVWPRSTYTVTTVTCPGQTIALDYVLYKTTGNITRRGKIEAVVNGSTSTIVDNFNYTGSSDGSIIFSVNLTRADAIVINAANAGTNGILTYNFNVRQ